MKLVSGSWDNTVKFWDISSHSLQETRKPINLKVAVLSTDMLSHTVVAGTYDKVNLHIVGAGDQAILISLLFTESYSDGRQRGG